MHALPAIDATEDLPTGENLILSASFDKDGEDPPHVSTGMLTLYYGDPWTFTGGTIHRVAVDVSGEPYVDMEREAQAMLMRE